jgi:hypothetical protein
MVEAKASVFNTEIKELKVELGDAAKEGRTVFEIVMSYFAPERTRLLRRIAREESLADTEAEVTKSLMRASGKVRELQIISEGDREVLEQAVLRHGFREVFRQHNLLGIAHELKRLGPLPISNEPVSEQVLFDIMDNCQDENDEWMQKYWAKLIAGEFAKPGSFSPKARTVLKSLRKEDAELFQKLCGFAWSFPNEQHKFIPNVQMVGRLVEFGIDFQRNAKKFTHNFAEAAVPYYSRMELESLGLLKISPAATQGINVQITADTPLVLHYCGTTYTIRYKGTSPPFKPFSCPADYLTPAGNEICSLCDVAPHDEFRAQFLATMRHLGFTIDESTSARPSRSANVHSPHRSSGKPSPGRRPTKKKPDSRSRKRAHK